MRPDCEYVCRLLNHMDEHGYDYCTPQRPDPSVEIKPFIDLMSGYVLRSIDKFPKQGDRAPWRMHQNYPRDILLVQARRARGRGRRVLASARRRRAGALAA